MRKYYIGEDLVDTELDIYQEPTSLEQLKNRVAQMSILAEVETRGPKIFVRVQEHGGTNQYMASAAEDLFWLKKFCETSKQIGAATFYYFKF